MTFFPFFKDCEVIGKRNGRYTYIANKLMINTVTSQDSGLYTCSLTFTLNGVTGSVSETIDAWITGTNIEGGGDFRAPLHQANLTFRVQFSSDRLCMS